MRSPAFRANTVTPIDINDPTLKLYIPLWYPDAETTGSTIISKDYNRHSCTVTGATWGYQGRTFDGSDDDIACGAVGSIGTGTCTLIVWFKGAKASQPVGSGYLITNKEGYDGNFIKLYMGTDGKLWLYTEAADGVNATISTAADYGDDKWHCAVATRNDTVGILIVDGVLSKTGTCITGNIGGATTWYIGASGNIATTTFAGTIGEAVAHIGKVFTLGEAQNYYQSTTWRFQ